MSREDGRTRLNFEPLGSSTHQTTQPLIEMVLKLSASIPHDGVVFAGEMFTCNLTFSAVVETDTEQPVTGKESASNFFSPIVAPGLENASNAISTLNRPTSPPTSKSRLSIIKDQEQRKLQTQKTHKRSVSDSSSQKPPNSNLSVFGTLSAVADSLFTLSTPAAELIVGTRHDLKKKQISEDDDLPGTPVAPAPYDFKVMSGTMYRSGSMRPGDVPKVELLSNDDSFDENRMGGISGEALDEKGTPASSDELIVQNLELKATISNEAPSARAGHRLSVSESLDSLPSEANFDSDTDQGVTSKPPLPNLKVVTDVLLPAQECIALGYAQMTGMLSVDASYVKETNLLPLQQKAMYRIPGIHSDGGHQGGGGSLGINHEHKHKSKSSASSYPIFNTPPSIIFLDEKLKKGQSKSCSN